MILRVPATSGIITSNDGAITYAEITGEGLATDAYTQAVINSQGLTFLNTSILDYCAVYNGAVKTVNDDGTFNITLPFTISGFSTTPDATESDSGLSVGSTITYDEIVSALNLYAVPASTSRKSVDLTTLTGWEALSSGTHNITVVAKADGYRDSEPSEAVSVTKQGAHTLTISGCYAFVNESLVNSGYTLKNGDTISISQNEDNGGIRANATLLINDVEQSLDGSNKAFSNTSLDIVLALPGTVSPFVSFVIDYTEDGGGSMSETWLLNGNLSKMGRNTFTNINFTSNGQTFTSIITRYPAIDDEMIMSYDSTTVVTGGGVWTNEAYKTITFETAPTGNLLTWLQANATKQ